MLVHLFLRIGPSAHYKVAVGSTNGYVWMIGLCSQTDPSDSPCLCQNPWKRFMGCNLSEFQKKVFHSRLPGQEPSRNLGPTSMMKEKRGTLPVNSKVKCIVR